MATFDARPTTFTPLTTQFEWEKLFSAMGIFDGIDGSNDLVPSSPAGGNISVAAGTVIIKGQMWRCDAPQPTPLPANPAAGMTRTDVLFIQYNRAASTSPTVVQLLIATGSPAASNPVPPPPTQNPVGSGGSGVWQIPVAQWTVNNAGAISGFKDIRQFSGKSTILMFSTARPAPVQPRLGLEIDTGNVMRWDGSAWQSAVPASPPKVQSWHWTFGGAAPGLAESVIPGSQQSITVNFPSMLAVIGLVDIALPASGGAAYTAFAQLDGANVEGNSFIVAQGPGIRLTLSRTWVTTVTTGTHQVAMAHDINPVVSGTNMRGGALTVLAIPT
jgi:hypothetical protein